MIVVRALADAELTCTTTPEELIYLKENPLLWLRALTQILRDVETHIAEDKRRLVGLRPKPGQPPSAAYLEKKSVLDQRAKRRIHFYNLVKRRISEVTVLLGDQSAVPLIGEVIHAMLRIETLADQGEYDSVAALARTCAEKWQKHA